MGKERVAEESRQLQNTLANVVVPVGHAWQAVLPEALAYVPNGQRVHDALPGADANEPAGHDEHEAAPTAL